MKEIISPSVYCVAATSLFDKSLSSALSELGAHKYNEKLSEPLDGEDLAEFAGRFCYKSFEPKLNPNVTKIRENSTEYIQNIIKSGHGSVFEHVSVSFVFHNVSRVFTHELVRHRVGVGISQESLRYVRLEDLHFWFPTVFKDEFEKDPQFKKECMQVIENLEGWQRYMAKKFKLDEEGAVDFTYKKKITSAMRRFAPIGLGTGVVWSTNLRTARHVIEQRTAFHAEEEIRLVFNLVADILLNLYPSVFADYTKHFVDGYYEWKTPYPKI